MTTHEYYIELSAHDWYYQYANGNVFYNGKKHYNFITYWRTKDPVFDSMFLDFYEYAVKQNRPKPESTDYPEVSIK